MKAVSPINFGGLKGTNLPLPTNSTDAVNKGYVDGLVLGTSSVTQDPWHVVGASGEPAFQNGWVATGTAASGVLPPRFRKDPAGVVQIQGRFKGGTNAATAFTLPSGYRPDYTLTVPALVQGGVLGYVVVDTNGNVAITGSNTNDTVVYLEMDLGQATFPLAGTQNYPATLTTSTVAAETVVARFTIPPNFLSAGAIFRSKMIGQVSSNATLTYKVHIGTAGTTADAIAATFSGAAGNTSVHTSLDVMLAGLTTGSSGTVRAGGTGLVSVTPVSPVAATYTPPTVNTTVANYLTLTVTQSIAQTYTPFAASLVKEA